MASERSLHVGKQMTPSRIILPSDDLICRLKLCCLDRVTICMHKDTIALLSMICGRDVPWSNLQSSPLQDLLKWANAGVSKGVFGSTIQAVIPSNHSMFKNGQTFNINYGSLVISSP